MTLKLTFQEKADIRKAIAAGESSYKLADKYGISRRSINRIAIDVPKPEKRGLHNKYKATKNVNRSIGTLLEPEWDD